MQLKIVDYIILFTYLLYPVKGKFLPHKECCGCEEEVWEEVLCGSIPENTSAVAPRLTATTFPSIPTRSTTEQPIPATTPMPITSGSTTMNPYQKCCCECKVGCNKLFRKVTVSPSDKHIVQVSKITEPAANGRIQSTHIPQRKLVPDIFKLSNNDNANYGPSLTDESTVGGYSRSQPYPLPIESSFEEDSEAEPEGFDMPYYEKYSNILSKSRYANGEDSKVEPEPYHVSYHTDTNIPKPFDTLNAPIYDPYAENKATASKNVQPFNPHYNPPHSIAGYELRVPFEIGYTKVTRSLLDPAQDLQASVDSSIRKIPKPRMTYFTSSSSMRNSPSEARDTLDQYDVAFDSFLRNIIKSDSSQHSTPYYSLPYSS